MTATGPTAAVHGFTTAGGRYFLSGLRPGEYRIGFRACAQPGRYVDQGYGRPVLVLAGHPTSLGPVTLRPANAMAYLAASARAFRSSDRPASSSGPQISGIVTDSHGKPLARICVGANLAGKGAAPEPTGPGVRTGKHGTYRIGSGRLSPGRWKVFFSVGCGNKGNFAPQWWKFASTGKKAKVLVLHKNTHLTGINARLGKGGSISGTVRAGSKSGPGLPGRLRRGGRVRCGFRSGRGDENRPGGKYLVTGLGTGRYGLEFGPGCGNKGNFTPDPNSPIVAVTAGKITKGVDAFLPRAGEISGTVTTGPQHRPLGGDLRHRGRPSPATSERYSRLQPGRPVNTRSMA